MQNPTPTPAVPAPAPAPPPAPVFVQVSPQGGPTRPITQQEIGVIRSQRSEMSEQLTSAQNRRERILDELRSAPPGTEQGLREQYQVLSDRIVAIETDIEASGRTLRSGQVPVGTVIVPPRSFATGNTTDDVERGVAMGGMALMALVAVMAWKRFTRKRRRGETARNESMHDERMERLEQAVDAIALEIERVGEAQRFQAKLLAEANMMPAMGGSQKAGEPARMRGFDR